MMPASPNPIRIYWSRSLLIGMACLFGIIAISPVPLRAQDRIRSQDMTANTETSQSLRALIHGIHSDLMNLRYTNPAFSQYNETCLEESEEWGAIAFFPSREGGTTPSRLPQTPEQLLINIVSLQDTSQRHDFLNEVSNIAVCQFPTLGYRLVVRNSLQIEGARQVVQRIALTNCETLQRRISSESTDAWPLVVEAFRPTSQSSQGYFTLDQNVLVGLSTGSPQSGEVLRISSARFERSGNELLAVLNLTERAVIDSQWRISVTIMDRNSSPLSQSSGIYEVRVSPSDYPQLREGYVTLDHGLWEANASAGVFRIDVIRLPFTDGVRDMELIEGRLAPPGQREAFISACRLLSRGETRKEVARRMEEVAAMEPSSDIGRPASRLADDLARMATEDAVFSQTRPMDMTRGDQGIAYLVYQLRDLSESELIPDSRGRIFGLTQQNVADEFLEIGRPAVPALTGLLSDMRPTRIYDEGLGANGYVWRLSDVALELLMAIAKQQGADLFDESLLGKSDYFSQISAARRQIILEQARAWSGELGGASIEEWAGEVVDGLQARLTPFKPSFPMGEAPILFADIRNQGWRNWSMVSTHEMCEIEVDGEWFTWGLNVMAHTEWLEPGDAFRDIRLILDENWIRIKDREPLRMTHGSHSIRVAFMPDLEDEEAERSVRIVSNQAFLTVLALPPQGYGAVFDGVDDSFQAPDDPSLDLGSQFTVEAWVRIGNVLNERAFLSKEAPYFQGWSLSVTPVLRGGLLRADYFPSAYESADRQEDGDLYTFVFTVGDGARLHELTATIDWRRGPEPRIEQGEWHHVAVVWRDGEVVFFIDGVERQSEWDTSVSLAAPAQAPLSIGKSSGAMGRHFEGELADIRIWEVARSGQAIKAGMTKKLLGNEAGLVAAWSLQEPTESVVRDLGPKGLDAKRSQTRQRPGRLPTPQNVDAYGANKEFTVLGSVTDESGKPMEGVRVSAHCGIETLMLTGETLSGLDGRFVLQFAPSITMLSLDGIQEAAPQSAVIRASKEGFYEVNLNRHGALGMAQNASEAPEWFGGLEKCVLPDRPYSLDFSMKRAVMIDGRITALNGEPVPEVTITAKCEDGPPGLKYLDRYRSEQDGHFYLKDLPLGALWFAVAPSEGNEHITQSVEFNLEGRYEIQLLYNPEANQLEFNMVTAPMASVFSGDRAGATEGLPTSYYADGKGFGQIFQRFVTGSPNGNCFIDFDTGKLSPMPDWVDFDDEFLFGDLWQHRGGPDAYGQIYQSENLGFVCYYMKVVSVKPELWDTITTTTIQERLEAAPLSIDDANKRIYMHSMEDETATYLFETREGGQGILQIMEVRSLENTRPGNPSGIRVQYKMISVPKPTPTPSPTPEPTPTPTPSPTPALPTPVLPTPPVLIPTPTVTATSDTAETSLFHSEPTPTPIVDFGFYFRIVNDQLRPRFDTGEIRQAQIEIEPLYSRDEINLIYSIPAARLTELFRCLDRAPVWSPLSTQNTQWGRAVGDPVVQITLMDGIIVTIETALNSRPQFRLVIGRSEVLFDSVVLVDLIKETMDAGLKGELIGLGWSERRHEAALRLFRRGDRQGVPVLESSLMEGRRINARLDAACALAIERSPEALDVLIEMASQSSDEAGRAAILQGIIHYSNETIIDALRTICQANTSVEIRHQALTVLARIGTPAAIDTLLEYWGGGRNFPLLFLRATGQYFELGEYGKCRQWWQANRERPRMELLADGVWSDSGGYGSVCLEEMRKADANEAARVLMRRLANATGRHLTRIAQALDTLTGLDFGARKEAWERWWQAKSAGADAATLDFDADRFAGLPIQHGIQARLRADQQVWSKGQTPVLRLDLRNVGGQTWRLWADQAACEIWFNGDWYSYPAWSEGVYQRLEPGDVIRDITIELTEGFWTGRGNVGLLKWGGGTITVQAAITVYPVDGDNLQAEQILSNRLSFEAQAERTGGHAPAPEDKRLFFHGLDLSQATRTDSARETPDLFEKDPPWATEYSLRDEVIVRYDHYDGAVYALPDRGIFYVRLNKAGYGAVSYYGPFQGDPDERMDWTIPAPPSDTDASAVGRKEIKVPEPEEPEDTKQTVLPPGVEGGDAEKVKPPIHVEYAGVYHLTAQSDSFLFEVRKEEEMYYLIDSSGERRWMESDADGLAFRVGKERFLLRYLSEEQGFAVSRAYPGRSRSGSQIPLKKTDSNAITELERATFQGDLITVKRLLEGDPELLNETPSGRRVVHQAIQGQNADVLRYLLTWNPPLNEYDRVGRAPIHWAARMGREDMIEMLIEAGADVHLLTREGGQNAVHEVVLSEPGEGRCPRATLEILLAAGADTEQRDEEGNTPMDWVQTQGREELRALLTALDPNSDKYGRIWRFTAPDPQAMIWSKEQLPSGNAKDIEKQPFAWTITPDWPVRLITAWWTWDGTDLEHGGGGSSIPYENPIVLRLDVEQMNNQLILSENQSPLATAIETPLASVLSSVSIPPQSKIEFKAMNSSGRLTKQYAILYEVRFRDDQNNVIKTALLAARVANRNDRPLTTKEPPYDMSETPFTASLFGGPLLPKMPKE